MKRVVTGVVGAALVLLAVFLAPSDLFLALVLAMVLVAVYEYDRIAAHYGERSPSWLLYLLVPVLTVVICRWSWLAERGTPAVVVLLAVLVLSPLLVIAVMFARVSMEKALPAAGILTVGLGYFAGAASSIVLIQAADPWLLLLVLLIVWAGDTAAFYGGSAFGKHKLAPVVSPNKSWEGAAFSFAGALLATVIWSALRLGRIDLLLLVLAASTNVMAQLGDLFESLAKRGARVKDSGAILPGHGGMWDRMDALFLASPAFCLGLLAIGSERWLP